MTIGVYVQVQWGLVTASQLSESVMPWTRTSPFVFFDDCCIASAAIAACRIVQAGSQWCNTKDPVDSNHNIQYTGYCFFFFIMCWILLWNMSVTSASTQFSSGVKRSKTMSVIHVYFKWLNFVWCQQFGLMSFSFRLGDTLRQTLVFLQFSLNICASTRLSSHHIVLLKIMSPT